MTMIPLPGHFDTRAAGELMPTLRVALSEGGGDPVMLDGSPVERIGLAGLQLLLSARRAADAAGRDFILSPVSQPLLTAATLIGAEPLLWQGTDPIVAEGSRDAA